MSCQRTLNCKCTHCAKFWNLFAIRAQENLTITSTFNTTPLSTAPSPFMQGYWSTSYEQQARDTEETTLEDALRTLDVCLTDGFKSGYIQCKDTVAARDIGRALHQAKIADQLQRKMHDEDGWHSQDDCNHDDCHDDCLPRDEAHRNEDCNHDDCHDDCLPRDEAHRDEDCNHDECVSSDEHRGLIRATRKALQTLRDIVLARTGIPSLDRDDIIDAIDDVENEL